MTQHILTLSMLLNHMKFMGISEIKRVLFHFTLYVWYSSVENVGLAVFLMKSTKGLACLKS